MTDETNLPVSELSANDVVYDIVGKSVVDQNNTTNLKMWSGTKAEYEALESIDETTMYLIKDDVEPLNSQTLFDCKWLDYAVDSLCWKNANDFAWISGDIYKDAYEHLVEDVNEKSADNSDTIGSYTIWYVLADDGHKIVGPDQATAAENIYNESGVAWYYILDKNNHRFKLPRTKFAFTGYRDGAGNYVEPGLPNITGSWRFNDRNEGNTNVTGVYRTDYGTLESYYVGVTGGATNSNFGMSFDASRSNSIYGNSTTVQPPATQMYLYFFVGNLIVNQYEIDANGFATKHLDNLSSIGKNIANWSSNVTNCITEIPQDIKLELSEGTLTLKAGSKVFIPNGFESDGVTRHFDEYIIPSDISQSTPQIVREKSFVNLNYNKTALIVWLQKDVYTGDTTPTIPNNNAIWYDTANNIIKYTGDGGSTWISDASLPFCLASSTATEWTSLDQVFNGIGYIGSCVFVLPGVKGLIPNGRNADGTLKNISITTNKVYARTVTWEQSTIGGISLSTNSQFYWNTLDYNEKENLNYDQHGNLSRGTTIGYFTSDSSSNHKISYFNPKTVFHALDWNDSSTVAAWAMPSKKYIDLTLKSSGTIETSPGNGFIVFSKQTTANDQNAGVLVLKNGDDGIVTSNVLYGNNDLISASGNYVFVTVPVKKGDKYITVYTAGGSLIIYRFIYAEGEL